MADYKKYAENLIGNWNTDQYEPLRDSTLNIYKTNWERLQNDFDKYVTNVRRNLDLKREGYYNNLASIDKDSVARVGSAVEDLSKRGLLNSGIANRYIQANTSVRGNAVNNALADIINTNNSLSANLADAVSKAAEKENTLNANLAASLAGITGREQANAQGAANLAASLAGSAEARDMNNALVQARIALSGSGSSKQEEEDELARRQRIYDLLAKDDLTDSEKVRYLSIYLDVPAETGEKAVKAFKDNKDYFDTKTKLDELAGFTPQYIDIPIPTVPILASNKTFDGSVRDAVLGTGGLGINPNYLRSQLTGDNTYNVRIPTINTAIKQSRLNKLNSKMDNLSYTDLYELLYGEK